MPRTSRRDASDGSLRPWQPAGSVLLIGLLYMLTFPRNLTEAEDAVFYVDHIDEAIAAP